MKEILIPDTFNPIGPHADNLALLANELMFRTCQEDNYYWKGHYISFGRDNWRNVLPCKTYGPVKEDAIKLGLIEMNPKYSNFKGNRFSMSIRLTDQHRKAPAKTYTLKRHQRAKNRFTFDKDDKVGIWLANKLPLFTLDPRLDDVQFEKLKSTLKIEADARFQRTGKKEDKWTDKKINHLNLSIDKLRRRRHYASRCEYGRFHSLFTQIKRELRDYIQFNGSPLVDVDIANCQPLLLGILGKGDTYDKNNHLNNLINNTHNHSIIFTEFSDYISLCSKGQLYEHLLENSDGQFVDRNDVKDSFLPFLFDKNNSPKRRLFSSLFNSEFPHLTTFCTQMKNVNHEALAWACQKFESTLMIDGACEILRKANPDIPLLTVHDSIMTTPEHLPEVKAAIYEAFSEHDVRPKLKVKEGTSLSTDSQALAV
ncbi:MAG: hypothetical protein ACKVH8_17670 [Pirellulales bacterium]